MKIAKIIMLITCLLTAAFLHGCGNKSTAASQKTLSVSQAGSTEIKKEAGAAKMQGKVIKITVGDKQLRATLEDNAATRALMQKMPMTLNMENLYAREMCYRYGQGGLPTDKLRSDNYQVGDIAYWPPRGSLVILYAQNGEQFERQQIGHIDKGVEIFNNSGTQNVTFELVK